MEVSKIYSGKVKPVFEVLINLFIEDYESNTGKAISVEEIVHGLTYIRKMGPKGRATLKVLEFSAPKSYKVEISSNRGKQIIYYYLEELGSEQLKITYSESNEPLGIFSFWNYKILQPFFKKRLQQRMLLQIDKLVEFSQSPFMTQ